jgi:hypothetical protein
MVRYWTTIPVNILLLLALVSVAHAQINYLSNATLVWQKFSSPVLQGNGVFLSPAGDLAVVVSRDATVRAFDPLTGKVAWVFTPSKKNLAAVESFSGAFFSTGVTTPYIAYSVNSGGQTQR